MQDGDRDADHGERRFGGDDPMAVANLNDAEIDGVIAHLRANAW